jgi:hypothetical protein
MPSFFYYGKKRKITATSKVQAGQTVWAVRMMWLSTRFNLMLLSVDAFLSPNLQRESRGFSLRFVPLTLSRWSNLPIPTALLPGDLRASPDLLSERPALSCWTSLWESAHLDSWSFCSFHENGCVRVLHEHEQASRERAALIAQATNECAAHYGRPGQNGQSGESVRARLWGWPRLAWLYWVSHPSVHEQIESS